MISWQGVAEAGMGLYAVRICSGSNIAMQYELRINCNAEDGSNDQDERIKNRSRRWMYCVAGSVEPAGRKSNRRWRDDCGDGGGS